MPLLRRAFLALTAMSAVSVRSAGAQQPPANAPRLPGAGRGTSAPVPAETLARFPAGTFLESVVATPDGAIHFSDHDKGTVLRLVPGGTPQTVAQVPGKLAGLAPALSDDGALLASGWAADGVPTVFAIARDGRVAPLVRPDGAAFLNGFAHLRGQRYLLADSARGAIWEIDAARASAAIWLADPLFERRAPSNSNPGANGLKIFDDHLYVTNSDRALIARVRLNADDRPAGAPEVFLDDLLCDDLAFSTAGDMYLATHPLNSVVRISPDRRIAILADASRGLTGATAVAFGRGPSAGLLFAVTNGGVFAPPPGGPVPAEVVALRVAANGTPVIRT